MEESGRVYSSSYHQWQYLTTATAEADGKAIVEYGNLAAEQPQPTTQAIYGLSRLMIGVGYDTMQEYCG